MSKKLTRRERLKRNQKQRENAANALPNYLKNNGYQLTEYQFISEKYGRLGTIIKDSNNVFVEYLFAEGDIEPFDGGIITEKVNDFIKMLSKYMEEDYAIERYNSWVFTERDRASYMLMRITDAEDMKFAAECFEDPEDRVFWRKADPRAVRHKAMRAKEDLNDYINYELGIRTI